MESPPRVLPDLPWDIVERIAVSNCRAGGLREWCSTWRATCRAFAELAWFEHHVRGGVKLAVVPSEAYPTVQAGVSRAQAASPAAVAAAAAERARFEKAKGSRGVGRETAHADASRTKKENDALGVDVPAVLVKRGAYAENVRITRSVFLCGWGAEGDVRVEGGGWEPALAFAGLGVDERAPGRGGGVNSSAGDGKVRLSEAAFDTGGRAICQNVTLRCRNRAQAYAAIVVAGTPVFERVIFEGGALVLGAATNPTFSRCAIRGARGAGCKVTDHGCFDMFDACVVEKNGSYGLCLERHGSARVDVATAMRVRGSADGAHEAVLQTPDSPGVAVFGVGDADLKNVHDARAWLLKHTRLLAPGAETQTYLHGEAVEGKWLEACGIEHWSPDAIGYGG